MWHVGKIIKLLKLKQLSTWAVRNQGVGRGPWGHPKKSSCHYHAYIHWTVCTPPQGVTETREQLGQPCGHALLARMAGPTFELRPSWLPNPCIYWQLHWFTTRQDARKQKWRLEKRVLPRGFALNTQCKCPMGPREALANNRCSVNTGWICAVEYFSKYVAGVTADQSIWVMCLSKILRRAAEVKLYSNFLERSSIIC